MQSAQDWAIGVHENLTYCTGRYEALENSDALLLVTEWDEFRVVDWDILKQKMNTPLVLDGRNIYDPVELKEAGVKYERIG